MNKYMKMRKVQDFKEKWGFSDIDENQKGVYLIYICSTDFCYIGETTRSFKERFSEHKTYLKGGYHGNKNLQELYYEYGEDDFEYIPIYVCDEFMNKYIESAYVENYGLKTINDRGVIRRFEWQSIKDKDRIMLNGISVIFRIIIEEHKIWKCKGREKILQIKFENYLNESMISGMEIKSKEKFRWINDYESKEIFELINELSCDYDEFIKMPLDFIGLNILNDILGNENHNDVFNKNNLKYECDRKSHDLIYNIYKRIRKEDNFLAYYVNTYFGWTNSNKNGFLRIEMFKKKITCIMDALYFYILILIIDEIEMNVLL